MKSNFDFGRMFTHGVPYLGRNEEALVREQYKSRNDRSTTIPDMVVPASDIDALAFYRDARRTITTWVEDTKVCYTVHSFYRIKLVVPIFWHN